MLKIVFVYEDIFKSLMEVFQCLGKKEDFVDPGPRQSWRENTWNNHWRYTEL